MSSSLIRFILIGVFFIKLNLYAGNDVIEGLTGGTSSSNQALPSSPTQQSPITPSSSNNSSEGPGKYFCKSLDIKEVESQIRKSRTNLNSECYANISKLKAKAASAKNITISGDADVVSSIQNSFKDYVINAKNIVDKANDITSKQPVFESSIQSCLERGSVTDQICCDNTSEKAQQARNLIGAVLPTLQGASSQLACSKFNKVMTTVSGLMTAWNLACSSAKMVCDSSCDKVKDDQQKLISYLKQYGTLAQSSKQSLEIFFQTVNKKYTEIKTLYEPKFSICKQATTPEERDSLNCNVELKDLRSKLNQLEVIKKQIEDPNVIAFKTELENVSNSIQSCQANAENGSKAIDKRVKLCGSWGTDLGASAMGMAGFVLKAKQKHNCGPAEEANTCNTSAPTAATCAAFCADAANKSNPACRCILNPLASGCMDGGRGVANGSGGGNFNAMNFNKPAGMGPGSDTTTNPAPEFGGPSSGASGGGGGRGGGGGLGGGGSVLGSSGKPGGGAAGKSGSNIDTKIISGVEGGGGGGGSKAGGGYAANPAVMNKLKADLKARESKPKYATIEEDPRVQITGAGGKTNWEKVSERYKDMSVQMIKEDE